MFNFFKKGKVKYKLQYFSTPLVWHCNLNCKYCDHFSPIADKKFIDLKSLKKDFKRISEIMEVDSIGLMGGEPLLHPNISEILKMTRKIFSKTKILLFTNGILLENIDDYFWKICKENNIFILITKYKINLNYNKIFEKTNQYNVKAGFEGIKNNKEFKQMHKIPLDLSGLKKPDEMHKICWQKEICNSFEDGKFYQCSITENIKHFNKYFNKNLEVKESDYLNIYKVKSKQDIENYFSKPLEFCKYCCIDEQEENLPFEISKKDINEWIK